MLSRYLFRISLLIVLFFISSTSFAQITNPVGEKVPTQPSDILPKTMSGSHFNEFWNFQFYLDNGMKAHIVFSMANFGRLKSPVTGVRISIYGLDNKEVYQLSREYPFENLFLDRESYEFNLNPRQQNVWFKGTLGDKIEMYINTAKDGERFVVELSIDQFQQGFKWGDGVFSVGNEEIGIITHIPYARVTGRLGINDNVKNVTGTVYMDHTFQNQNTTSLMHSGYRFVHHKDAKNWDVVYILQPKDQMGRQTLGYRLFSDNGNIQMEGITGIINSIDGRAFRDNIPQTLTLFTTEESVLTLVRTEDLERFSVLEQLSWAARRVARTFLGGDVIDFRGRAKLTDSNGREIHGAYNFFFVN